MDLRRERQKAKRMILPMVLFAIQAAGGAAQDQPPKILEIYRDSMKPGGEAAYRQIEEDAARICFELKCPNPHLAIESLNGAPEVWWLNAFESGAHKEQVDAAYRANKPLMAALGEISKRKASVTGTPVNVFAAYNPGASRDPSWAIAGARYMIVITTSGSRVANGAAFDAPDGTRFILKPVRTRPEADAAAAAAGPRARVFAIRPYWGLPAQEWIDADREFWKVNPSFRPSQVFQ